MAANSSTGSAGRMQIARILRGLLGRAGLTQTEVAKEAGVSVGTVNRYMAWQTGGKLTIPTMRAIADACGATSAERDALVQLVRGLDTGWWMSHPAVAEWLDPLMAFEDSADFENVYANSLVPGLLQTERYALAVSQAQETRAEPEVIRAEVDARIKRQAILDRSPALHLWVVLDEAVLNRTVGDNSVMAEQIDHLNTMSYRPNVDIQILPFSGGAHAAGSGGHFLILGREGQPAPLDNLTVVYLELHRRGLYLDSPDDARTYETMFDYLRSQADDSTSSRDLLRAARKRFTS
ncbi:helix-turn-helix domain-containing protein [Streptomyces sp. NPDC057910]|uniref:helix-turn-helix domain-containing protein n=1 Tax=Streptomyces sp. NPDC057910 TaxID=3346278 RepID=UPI0036EFE8B1